MELGARKVGSNNHSIKKSPSGDKSGVPKFRFGFRRLASSALAFIRCQKITLAEKELGIPSTSSKKKHKEIYFFPP